MGGSFEAEGEDIWAGGEDIWGSEDIGWRPHICSPLGCWNLGGPGSTVSKHKCITKNIWTNTDSFGTNLIWPEMEKRLFRNMIRK